MCPLRSRTTSATGACIDTDIARRPLADLPEPIPFPGAVAVRTLTPGDSGELAHRIVDIASDHKAADIVLLRIAELTSFADYFVICSGRSDRQVSAIAGAIQEEIRVAGVRPIGVEGRASSRWMVIDYGTVLVHVFTPDERAFYGLEKLWSEAVQVVRMV